MAGHDVSLDELTARLISDLSAANPGANGWRLHAAGVPLSGASNTTILGELTWQELNVQHSLPIAIRVAPAHASLFPTYDLARQFTAMRRLGVAGVSVPKLVGELYPASVEGRDAFVMERVEGRYLNDNPPYYAEGWLLQMSAQERRALWLGAMDAMVTVNQVDWPSVGFADLWDTAAYATPLDQHLAQVADHLAWAEALGQPYPVLHALLAWLIANKPAQQVTALCWGDAKPTNLMVDERSARIVALLDWEGVRLHDPVYDLAWWLMLDSAMGEGIGLSRLEGIPSQDELVARWQQAGGFSTEHFDYYMGLCLLQFGVIMHRVGTLMTQSDIVPEALGYDRNNCATAQLQAYLQKHGIGAS